MATRQQIRSQLRTLLNETDTANTHFSDSELNEYINQAQSYLAVLIEWPRDFVEIQTEENIGSYTLLSDTLIIRTAYFGDKNTSGNIRPLIVTTEEALKAMFPSWLDETTSSQGKPNYLILLDKRTIHVYPRPNAAESASGKKIVLDYIYNPANMGTDADQPDLPTPYHNFLQFYAAHLAYLRLQNQVMSDRMAKDFVTKVKSIEPTLVKETKEGTEFQWADTDDVDASIGERGISF